MENKVKYEAMVDKNVSVWAMRCNVREYDTAVPYLMCPCFPVIQPQLYTSHQD